MIMMVFMRLTGRYNDNALFCSAGSAYQDWSAGGYQGHGRHGGKYSVAMAMLWINYLFALR